MPLKATRYWTAELNRSLRLLKIQHGLVACCAMCCASLSGTAHRLDRAREGLRPMRPPGWLPLLIKLRRGANSAFSDALPASRDKVYCATFARILRTTAASWKMAADTTPAPASDLPPASPYKVEFLATLAHELRHPLAPIKNGLDILRLRADDPAVVRQTAAMMERQVSQMSFLIHQMQEMTRLGVGKLVLENDWVDIKTLIANAIETSSPWIEAARHALRVTLPEQALVLKVDARRMVQVLVNLLNNAAKYTPAGGLIEVAACQEGDEVVITVTDNGVGIAQKSLAGVFEMFGQVAQHGSRAQDGLGIGLSLVRQLVRLHGGTVSASSAGPGRGSAFMLRLPWERVSRDDLAGAATPHVPVEAAQSKVKGMRILVVDDHAESAQTLATLLALNGHTTAVAHDGYQALEKTREFRPALVFLDIGMPGLNGYETARALRAMAGLEGLILVALTGWKDEESRKRAQATGFDHHLSKPADLAAIKRLLPQII